ncbi:MAG: hypothetical protein NC319_04825 [Butyricicoccus sp.]|nr:hypothetical protein [Butyricicoccus sp.]
MNMNEKAGWGTAEGQSPAPPAPQCFFRGEPLGWLTVQKTKTVVTENAIGDSEASERPDRKEHWIVYRSGKYKKEAFYKMAFG